MKINDRNLRTSTRLLMALPIAALAFSLAACGGAAAERPSAEEVSSGLQKVLEEQGMGDALTGPIMDCLSEALVDSEVSDETLAAIADGNDTQSNQEEFALVQETVIGAATECATAE